MPAGKAVDHPLNRTIALGFEGCARPRPLALVAGRSSWMRPGVFWPAVPPAGGLIIDGRHGDGTGGDHVTRRQRRGRNGRRAQAYPERAGRAVSSAGAAKGNLIVDTTTTMPFTLTPGRYCNHRQSLLICPENQGMRDDIQAGPVPALSPQRGGDADQPPLCRALWRRGWADHSPNGRCWPIWTVRARSACATSTPMCIWTNPLSARRLAAGAGRAGA